MPWFEKLAGHQNALFEAHLAMIDDLKELKREILAQQVLAAEKLQSTDEPLPATTRDNDEIERGRELDRQIAEVVAAINARVARKPPPPDQTGLQQ